MGRPGSRTRPLGIKVPGQDVAAWVCPVVARVKITGGTENDDHASDGRFVSQFVPRAYARTIDGAGPWCLTILGWLLTIRAPTLGAPFCSIC